MPSKCVCNDCEEVTDLPKFEECDYEADDFIASCPACRSTDISYSIMVDDLSRVPFFVRTKILSELYDH